MITGYLNQSLQIKRKISIDAYGKAAYSASETLKARVEEKRSLVRDKTGNQVVSQATIFVSGSVGLEDRVIFSDGREFPVIVVLSMPSFTGDVEYWQVYV